ncbi:phosphatase domain-containing protein [Jatrophihabitans sp. YIM 134969]
MAGDRNYTVFDIDGVVADVSHRLHHLEPRQRDWFAFHEAADRDPVLGTGRALAEQAALDGDIVWLTGRPAWSRRLTQTWLDAAGLPAGPLLMREDGDHRPAKYVKLQEIRRLGRERAGELITVVDDDPAVVDTLTAAGFPTLLATWLPRRDPRHDVLADAQEKFGRA